MTKKDLNEFYIVKLRNGDIRIVLRNSLAAEGYATFMPTGGCQCYFEEYRDDLTNKRYHTYDIVAVRKAIKKPSIYNTIKEFFDGCYANPNYRGWDWERKEVEEMTLEEVCKALGKEIKIVKK